MGLRDKVFAKAVIDYVLVLATLPFWLSLIAFFALIIKIKEPGESVFFKQKRIGLKGKAFNCYKFRSMHKNWRKILDDYLELNPDEILHFNKFHKYKFDPRITSIGGIIRRTSIDELPQLFNVLRLEMSLVGPRPYMIYEKRRVGRNLKKITSVRPGITGFWQVSGRNEISFDERVKMECEYVDNISLFGDIAILFKTVAVVLKPSRQNADTTHV